MSEKSLKSWQEWLADEKIQKRIVKLTNELGALINTLSETRCCGLTRTVELLMLAVEEDGHAKIGAIFNVPIRLLMLQSQPQVNIMQLPAETIKKAMREMQKHASAKDHSDDYRA